MWADIPIYMLDLNCALDYSRWSEITGGREILLSSRDTLSPSQMIEIFSEFLTFFQEKFYHQFLLFLLYPLTFFSTPKGWKIWKRLTCTAPSSYPSTSTTRSAPCATCCSLSGWEKKESYIEYGLNGRECWCKDTVVLYFVATWQRS